MPDCWTIVASVGAGKTIGAGAIVDTLWQRYGANMRLVVVAPSVDIVGGWTESLWSMFRIPCARRKSGKHDRATTERSAANIMAAVEHSEDTIGVALTYQAIASPNGALVSDLRRLCQRHKVVVVLDEVHHCSESAAFGVTVEDALGGAAHIICLSGTPFRADRRKIPFVSYDSDGVVAADHSYSYRSAVMAGDCRPLSFSTFVGEQRWVEGLAMTSGRDDAGRLKVEVSADFDDDLDERGQSRRLATALSEDSNLTAQMLRDADEKLSVIRRTHKDAAGLVVCRDRWHAKQVRRRLSVVTGCDERSIALALGDYDGLDDSGAAKERKSGAEEIDRFRDGDERWIVAVKMVSEGVDIPRLRVLAYCSNVVSRLFFMQVCGRIVRTRSLIGRRDNDHSYVFMPGDARLIELAQQIESDCAEAVAVRDIEDQERDRSEREETEATWSPLEGEGELGATIIRGEVFGDSEMIEMHRRFERETGQHIALDAFIAARRWIPTTEAAPVELHPDAERDKLVKKLNRKRNKWVNAQVKSGARLSRQECYKAWAMWIKDSLARMPDAPSHGSYSQWTLRQLREAVRFLKSPQDVGAEAKS